MSEKISYCAQIVRDFDPDRFLMTMLMPAEFREDLLCLFAFNHEIAKTREVVSETMLGQIRLKWWQEGIKEIYDGAPVRQHEILMPLARVIEERGLSYEYFETMIYAREFDLEDVLPGNLEGLANYCDFTLGPLLKLVLQVMGDDPETQNVQPVAINYALCGLLRAVPFHGGQRRCYLPEDLMQEHGQSLQGLYEGKIAENFYRVIEQTLEVYEYDLKPENPFLRASHILSQIYYKHIKNNKFNVLAPNLMRDPPFKVLRLVAGYYLL
tara:strand:- start:205 stop:1008 length:804 start_codon:yes stop_codon:yes gene_type:complete